MTGLGIAIVRYEIPFVDCFMDERVFDFCLKLDSSGIFLDCVCLSWC